MLSVVSLLLLAIAVFGGGYYLAHLFHFDRADHAICNRALNLTTVRKLEIYPGEILIVSAPKKATMDQRQNAISALRSILPEGVEVLLETEGWNLTVVKKSQYIDEDAVTVGKLLGLEDAK